MSEELEKKVAELEVIAKSASNKQDKDMLVSVMRALVAIIPQLDAIKSEHAYLVQQNELLQVENKDLKDTLLEKDYYILHLKKNLKSYMDRDEIK